MQKKYRMRIAKSTAAAAAAVLVLLLIFTWGFHPQVASAATINIAVKPAFQADLTNTLKLQGGTGNPTFTRATTATVMDWEGLVRPVLSGEARFTGARRVRNLFGGSSENISNGNWGLNNVGSFTPTTLTFTTATNDGVNNVALGAAPIPSGTTAVVSATMWTNSGTKNVRFRVGGAYSSNILINTIPTRYSAAVTSTGGSQHGVYNGSDGVAGTINVTKLQLEDITGQTNTNPSEYVSKGVLAAPYQGAGVDGVQYFNTLNGNSVTSNVVTAGVGQKITSVTAPAGYAAGAVDASGSLGSLAEGSRTNTLLQSEAFSTTPWTNDGSMTITADNVSAPNGTLTADKIVCAGGRYRV